MTDDDFVTELMKAVVDSKQFIYDRMTDKGYDPFDVSICITASILSTDLKSILLRITLDDMERKVNG